MDLKGWNVLYGDQHDPLIADCHPDVGVSVGKLPDVNVLVENKSRTNQREGLCECGGRRSSGGKEVGAQCPASQMDAKLQESDIFKRELKAYVTRQVAQSIQLMAQKEEIAHLKKVLKGYLRGNAQHDIEKELLKEDKKALEKRVNELVKKDTIRAAQVSDLLKGNLELMQKLTDTMANNERRLTMHVKPESEVVPVLGGVTPLAIKDEDVSSKTPPKKGGKGKKGGKSLQKTALLDDGQVGDGHA
ncbi:hypothetical protein ERJ75_001018700 [Trypanosoma vivax]|uniref:Uncharacterized protein n=1 Tax=Trypanosoma vivax (strain Y486) TaxID=1055687 RepID=G0U2C1_TRYVY|nr:hypothetical protein TRVL_06812 [Trypanosoma vivax]KAH8611227.1 hypothetical protein ERJ75_001018700 [Trypanosoma vivax]CCC50424.1 hypothetical protein TVY486_0902460 [Trypanosoma vivax Y486]